MLRPLSAAEPAADPRPRLALIVAKGLCQFLNDLARALSTRYEARIFEVANSGEAREAMAWADLIWLEWCNEVAIAASAEPMAATKPVVCRLHRYEAFTAFPRQVMWSNVDRLILVADHLRQPLLQRCPALTRAVGLVTIPNGVALDRYAFRERRPGTRLAAAGLWHTRKNPMLLLQLLSHLVATDDRYTLHMAGRFQEPLLEWYWHDQVDKLGLQDHLVFDGWQDDLGAWLGDKDYLLSTSLHESFGYTIAEAMACGIKPVVHDFPYAAEVWPEEVLFRTVAEGAAMIQAETYESQAYRAFIESHYALTQQAEQVARLLDDVATAYEAPRHERGGSAAPATLQAQSFLDHPGALRAFVERVGDVTA